MAFARSVRDQEQFALKFFLMPEDFEAEVDVYNNSPLGKLLPRVEGMYANREKPVFVDPAGHKLPPCIVMERGESLDEWSCRRKPEMWAAMPVCTSSPLRTILV